MQKILRPNARTRIFRSLRAAAYHPNCNGQREAELTRAELLQLIVIAIVPLASSLLGVLLSLLYND
jgi:hypothetical protein